MGQRSISQRADDLSRRRARILPVLAILYIAQQASYITMRWGAAHPSVNPAKISAWLVLSAVLVAALATNGFWLQRREVRSMLDDEVTRSNRNDAMRLGFIFGMLTCIAVYFVTMRETVDGRDAVHIVMSVGLGAALIRWGWLERRAFQENRA
jgi:hypothetical protein